MSEHRLPSDSSSWPSDPFELLGVPKTVSAKDAKRAYLRLIRQFKPEHYPAEFQLIRSAFESVEQELQWREQFSRSDEEDTQDTVSRLADEANRKASENNSTSPENFLVIKKDDGSIELQAQTDASCLEETSTDTPATENPRSRANLESEAWNLAITGDLTTAYSQLVSLQNRPDTSPHLFPRLYWLLKLQPELDSQVGRCEWLMQGLRNGNFSGPCFELYRREVSADPTEAVSDRFLSLLNDNVTPRTLFEFLMWRWQGCLRLKIWRPIVDDIESNRRRLSMDAEDVWAQLLVTAIEFLAFMPRSDEVRNFSIAFAHELEASTHLHHSHGYIFDRLDLVQVLRDDWRRLKLCFQIPAPWLELVPLGWFEMYEVARPTLLPVMLQMRRDPQKSLDRFDQLHGISALGSTALLTLFEWFNMNREVPFPKRSREELKELVRSFFGNSYDLDYRLLRHDFLNVCIREYLSPNVAALILESLMEEQHELNQVHSQLSRDVSLRAIYAAYMAFEVDFGNSEDEHSAETCAP